MISSMTAYAQYETKKNWGRVIWDIRSLNQRYLEISVYLPDQVYNLEYEIRKRISSCLTRGKIECRLSIEFNKNYHKKFIFNKRLAKRLINYANWIKLKSGHGYINPFDVLTWPGITKTINCQNCNNINHNILTSFNKTLDNLIVARKNEGQSLKIIIEKRLKAISNEIIKIRAYIPEILKYQRERLLSKFRDIGICLENNRLEKELLLIAQRIDISEEIDRIEIHIQDIFNILNMSSSVGRKLDFIAQELNRESNTIASKSINIDITHSVIELKVLIEQIREQIQNIE